MADENAHADGAPGADPADDDALDVAAPQRARAGRVGRFEIGKDTAQELTESAATHVGRIATILTGAVRDLTRELGEWATDVFETREAAERARAAERD